MDSFEIIASGAVGSMGRVLYRPDEYAFDTHPFQDGEFSMLWDDINMAVSAERRVVSIWGLCPHPKWKKTQLLIPDAPYGELLVRGLLAPDPTIPVALTAAGEHKDVFVDRSTGWVVLRGEEAAVSAVQFLEGAIAEISAEGRLCALWLHPEGGIN